MFSAHEIVLFSSANFLNSRRVVGHGSVAPCGKKSDDWNVGQIDKTLKAVPTGEKPARVAILADEISGTGTNISIVDLVAISPQKNLIARKFSRKNERID